MSNARIDVKVGLERGYVDLFFRVFETGNSQGIPGAEVSLIENGESIYDVVTDARGEAAILDVPYGKMYDWEISASSFKSKKGQVSTTIE